MSRETFLPYISPKEHPHRLLDIVMFEDPDKIAKRVKKGEIPREELVRELDEFLTRTEQMEAEGQLTPHQVEQDVSKVRAILDRLAGLD